LRIAQQALADTTIRAPQEKYATPDFESAMRPATVPSGQDSPATRPTTGPGTTGRYVVAARYASVGELVRAVTPMFRLVDDDPLKLRAAVPERFFPEIRIGQQVRVRVEAYAEPFAGVVTRINPQIDVANRTFPIEVVVPNPKLVLPPGAFARASVQTRVQEGVVFVPMEAVVSFAGVDKVFTVQDGKAREVGVELGERRGNEIEVVKGLKGAEQVAVTGTSRLANGVPVEVRPATAAAKTQPAAARAE
jgi:membrane fusion protein (multidrug efflux system)